MTAHSRAQRPRPCVDCGTPVPTRHAERCKSCAARKRLRDHPNTDQLAKARLNSPTHARKATQTLPSGHCYVPIDTERLQRVLVQIVDPVRPADALRMSWNADQMPTRTLADLCADAHVAYDALLRWKHGQPRADLYQLDKLACACGVHVDLLIAEASA